MGKIKSTRKKVGEIITNFINETGGVWDWDDFISVPIEDVYLDSIRKMCASLPEDFPSSDGKGYCNEEGILILRSLANELLSESEG